MPDSPIRGSQSCCGVIVRPVLASDLPIFFAQQLDPIANRMAVVNPRDQESFDDHWRKVLSATSVVTRTIVADGEVVGSVSCFPMEGLDSVGYWIAREHWGKGIASRAVALLLEEVPQRPLHARAARTNIASIRVLTKNGFAITGYQHSPATERFPECEEAILVLE